MAEILDNKKVFMFNGKELLSMPNLSPEETKNHYSSIYPELVNAGIEFLGNNEQGVLIYEFKLKTGTKG